MIYLNLIHPHSLLIAATPNAGGIQLAGQSEFVSHRRKSLILNRISDMLNEASFLVNDYQMTHNKRRRDSSQMPRQPATPEYPQGDRSFSKPSMSTFPPNDYNPPLDAALGISDWDILLLQMGHIQPALDPSSSPTVFQTNHNSTSSLSHHIKQDSVLVPEDSVTDDLFSLWSDVPGAFR